MLNKRIVVLVISLFVVALIMGCGKKLDDAIVQKYSSKAEEVILLINNEDFEAIAAQFDDVMKSQLSVEQLAQITPTIVASGEYKGVKKTSVTEKDGYIVAVVAAQYAKENRVFTISYNDQEQIAGLFVR